MKQILNLAKYIVHNKHVPTSLHEKYNTHTYLESFCYYKGIWDFLTKLAEFAFLYAP